MSNKPFSTILIVDDQPDVIDSVTDHLNGQKNYRFLQAVNGKMAYEVAEKRKPDLIIMDWEMPLMNGYEALLKIKGNQKISHIPVIMATGRSSSEDLDQALNAGAADYIRKPIERQELLARVRTCLSLSMYIQEIKKKNDKLLDLNREKDGLINVVAHDLKSPLCTITGFIDLIKRDGSLNSKQSGYLSIIDNVTQGGMCLIEDLLDVHAFDYSESNIHLTAIDIREFINEWITTFNLELVRKEQQLYLKIQTENSHFNTDPLLLNRILNNLLSNAIKFSKTKRNIFINITETVDSKPLQGNNTIKYQINSCLSWFCFGFSLT
ncbi:MAG: response regulator [Carboxylicivirga sp.]|jgi:CheY-like chemotaxis protein|nr:response regulator [Carboxylicivirga sp.]